MTKGFLHGRTEAGRSCTTEVVAFTKILQRSRRRRRNSRRHSTAALPSTAGQLSFCVMWVVVSDAPAAEKVAAMRVAIKAHSNAIRKCAGAKGVDRHFFALKCMTGREVAATSRPA